MAPDSDDPDDAAALRERVRELEQTVSDHQDTIEKMLPSRRQAIAGGALLGGGLLGVAGASRRASAQSAAGQVGTSSEPVDVSAFDLDVAGQVTSNVDLGSNDLSAGAINGSSVNAEEATITNETNIEAGRSSDSGSISSGDYANAFDTDSKDNRDEFNSNAQFVPDKSGTYLIQAVARIGGGTSTGDRIQARVQNVSTGAPSSSVQSKPSSAGDSEMPFVFVPSLNAGDVHEIQFRNLDSSFEILTGPTAGKIIRSPVS